MDRKIRSAYLWTILGAVVVALGGLAASTVLTLLLIPAVYLLV